MCPTVKRRVVFHVLPQEDVMPIFEFKCLKCEDFFEILVMSKDEKTEMKCPSCDSENFERVLSTTNHSVSDGASEKNQKGTSQTRKCSSGSCTTYEIPGHTR